MDELIDIVSSTGEPTGKKALKSKAHQNGWWHNTIHVWLYTTEGEILLQQRSKSKIIHPLLWDVSAAGHIDAGESFETAAIRETKEELGLELSKNELKKIGVEKHESTYKNGTIKDNEFHQVFIAELKVGLNELTPQKNEVEAIKLISFTDFEVLLSESETNNHFIPSNKSYYKFVLNAIKKELSK